MAMTGQNFVDVARRALGDRDTISDETDLNTATLYAVNRTIRRLCNRFDWMRIRKHYTSTITTANYIFSLPTSTKSMLGAWLTIDNEGFQLQYISRHRKDDVFPETNANSNTSRPIYIGRHDEDNFWVHPYPDQSYTIDLRASIYPADITINSAHTLGDDLDQCIAAGAIAELFRQLQEPEDAHSWEIMYRTLFDEQKDAEKDQPDWTPRDVPSRMNIRGTKPGNYLTSPWYRLTK